jgi:hypothetical protein
MDLACGGWLWLSKRSQGNFWLKNSNTYPSKQSVLQTVFESRDRNTVSRKDFPEWSIVNRRRMECDMVTVLKALYKQRVLNLGNPSEASFFSAARDDITNQDRKRPLTTRDANTRSGTSPIL